MRERRTVERPFGGRNLIRAHLVIAGVYSNLTVKRIKCALFGGTLTNLINRGGGVGGGGGTLRHGGKKNANSFFSIPPSVRLRGLKYNSSCDG